MRYLLLFSSFLSFIQCFYAQGLIMDSKTTELIRQNYRVQMSRSSNLPSSYSLEKHAPYVFNQGESGMCAAYSLALARTIVYARNNNLTNKNVISAEAFSPYYIYSKYKSAIGEKFQGGLSLYLNKLNDFGYAKMKEVEYPHYYPFTETHLWDFSVPSYLKLDHDFIKSEKFDEINCIYVEDTTQLGRADLVTMIKSEIAGGKPIVFGMLLPFSFNISKDYWSDTIQIDTPEDYIEGGHAMTVIAYDDNRYNGAFLIQNSWGLEVHNEGKVWIPYDVFARYAHFIQSLDKKPKTEFEKQNKSHQFNYAKNEINFKTKDFSNYLDLNWILFTSMAVEAKDKLIMTEEDVVLPNNLSLKGSLKNNLMEGEGEINLNDRYVYKGQFKGGTFNGRGTLVQYDEWGDIISRKNGDFENGKFVSGDAKEMILDQRNVLNGCVFEGSVKQGAYSGFGTLSHNQRDFMISGIFENGLPKSGIIRIENWYYYEGEIKNLKPEGKGSLTLYGKKTEGYFINGEPIN
jgi:hypothetical protein